MKCANCGTDIPKGSLYCEKCGLEIQMVSSSDTEAELDLKQIFASFFREMEADEAAAHEEQAEKARLRTDEKKFKRLLIGLMSASAIVLLVFVIIFGLNHSAAYQSRKAAIYVQNGDLEQAEITYRKVISLKEEDWNARLALADVYYALGQFQDFELHLLTILEADELSTEMMSETYKRLLNYYHNEKRMQDINALLDKCSEPAVRKTIGEYISVSPDVDLSPGDYRGMQVVKLSCAGAGKIYYTLDGTAATESAQEYHVPLVLEKGTYEVRAIAVNSLGIPSKEVVFIYRITTDKLQTPVVYPISGIYHSPQLIELDGNVDEIYYTTDGSIPDEQDRKYTGPISMPVGISVFKFARMSGDEYSEVVECRYDLQLTNAITTQEASNKVLNYALSIGKIKDSTGWVDETGALLQFEYQEVLSIGEQGYFYIFSEKFLDSDGTSSYNGNQYAVDIYSGRLFSLVSDGYYNYELVEIENES